MSATHLHNHFYRCNDCGETFDDKGGEHRCEGSREDVLAMLEAEREENERLRAAITHAVTTGRKHHTEEPREAPDLHLFLCMLNDLERAAAT